MHNSLFILLFLLLIFQFAIKAIAYIYNKYGLLKPNNNNNNNNSKISYKCNKQLINKLLVKTKNQDDKYVNGIGAA